jgi:hypothetical protein
MVAATPISGIEPSTLDCTGVNAIHMYVIAMFGVFDQFLANIIGDFVEKQC